MAYKKEKEVKELETIKEGFKTRILTFEDGEKVLDIREFVDADKYIGFTKRGIRFDKSEAEKAIKVLTQALSEL